MLVEEALERLADDQRRELLLRGLLVGVDYLRRRPRRGILAGAEPGRPTVRSAQRATLLVAAASGATGAHRPGVGRYERRPRRGQRLLAFERDGRARATPFDGPSPGRTSTTRSPRTPGSRELRLRPRRAEPAAHARRGVHAHVQQPGSFTYLCKVHSFMTRARRRAGTRERAAAGHDRAGRVGSLGARRSDAPAAAPDPSLVRALGARRRAGSRFRRTRGSSSSSRLSREGEAGENVVRLSTRRDPTGPLPADAASDRRRRQSLGAGSAMFRVR